MAKNSDNSTDKRLKNLKPPFKKGQSGNPNGRPKGQKNYATLYREALLKLAELNDKDFDELELEIISKGLTEAHKGNYTFYRDVLDRLHGKPAQRTELTGAEGEALKILFDDSLRK